MGVVMDVRPILFAFVAGAVLGVGMYGCSRARADGSTSAHHEAGIASWYGSRHEDGRERPFGGPVACPGRHVGPMTAGHKSLACGTHVRVTTRAGAAVLTITDRGPYVRGRIIDVSPDAARVLGLISREDGRKRPGVSREDGRKRPGVGPGILPVTVERVQ
jgi:rare lipoprotein A